MSSRIKQCVDALHDDKNYISIKSHFQILVNHYEPSISYLQLEQSLHDFGLSRRKALALISELIDAIPFNKESDDLLHDDLSNIISGIMGECDPDAIIRFKGDPETGAELTNYVRNWEWTAFDWYNMRHT